VGEFTQALLDLREGKSDGQAVNALFQVTYEDLKRLAHERLRRNQPLTGLDTTSLVHESYLRFLNASRLELNDRGHFMVYAARVMRSVAIDVARRRSAERRGGAQVHVTLNTAVGELAATDDSLLQIDEALSALGSIDPRLVQIVELRYFAGLSVEEVSEHLGLSSRTVFREWEKARLLLLDFLRHD
jgi:RNA polymerase sigma factor (TIGR02999 family)